MEFAEEIIVEPYELHLSQGREQLALLHGVEGVLHLQFAASAGNGARGDEHHFMTLLTQPSHLIHDGGHSRDVEFPVCACQDIGTYFDNDAHNPCITALVKPASSMALRPRIVRPPGVVTLSISVSA